MNETETQQLVWSEAKAIEQQIYRELNDEGFMSQPVLAQLTLMMNLKGDAVQAGNTPPELPKVFETQPISSGAKISVFSS